ncbi:MAG: MarR family transcriptional regulator [Bacteroidota bacterium]
MNKYSDKLNLPLGVILGKTLRELHLAMQTRLNKELAELDLTIEHLRLLKIVSEHPGCDQNFLANNTQRGKSAMTRIISTMIDNGYLEKSQSQTDGRANLIYATEKGKLLADKGLEKVTQLTNDLFGTNEKDLMTLIALANKTIEKLK